MKKLVSYLIKLKSDLSKKLFAALWIDNVKRDLVFVDKFFFSLTQDLVDNKIRIKSFKHDTLAFVTSLALVDAFFILYK